MLRDKLGRQASRESARPRASPLGLYGDEEELELGIMNSLLQRPNCLG